MLLLYTEHITAFIRVEISVLLPEDGSRLPKHVVEEAVLLYLLQACILLFLFSYICLCFEVGCGYLIFIASNLLSFTVASARKGVLYVCVYINYRRDGNEITFCCL